MIAIFVAGVCGVATWTFLEYVIHRWGGHDRRFRKTAFGREHLRHHIEGDYFAPTWKKVIVAVVVTGALAPIAILAAGTGPGLAYTAGMIGFYGIYEWLHRRDHTHAGVTAYGRRLRRHHFRHHLVDARTNFGVTSPVWDVVFGTYRAPGQIAVPAKLVMPWLVDPATGDVRAEYARTFVLRSSKDPAAEAGACGTLDQT